MHSYRRGVQPPKRKRRYLEKDTRLKHIVSTYHTYENNVAAYLDLLAQLYIDVCISVNLILIAVYLILIAVYLIHIAVYLIL